MSEDEIQKFLRLLDEMDAISKAVEDLQEAKAEFIDEVAILVAGLTYSYFSETQPLPGLSVSADLDEVELREQLVAQRFFTYYCQTTFDQMCDNVRDFAGNAEASADRKLYYRKIEWRSFTPEVLEQKSQATCEKHNIMDSEMRELMHALYRRDAVVEQYYQNFEMLLHKALKKLALKYFPEIKELSATGLRETDYALYLYMGEFYEHVMVVVEGELNLTLDESMYPDPLK